MRLKLFRSIICSAPVVITSLLVAQEPPLPTKDSSPPVRLQLDIPEIGPSVTPTVSPDGSNRPSTPLFTPAPAGPGLSQLDAAFKRSPLAQAAEELRMHIEWRQLQNRTAQDPEVVAAKAAADRARTDLEKRERLRAYYKIFYAHMRALASTPEMAAYLDGKKAALLGALAQTRVRPEASVSPHPETH